MPVVNFIWDLEENSDGNYWHICVEGHGLTRDEVEEVIMEQYPGETTSRSSGLPTVFGWTSTGLYIAVIFEIIDPATAEVYPVTAYEVDPPRTKKRKKR